jgi:hypothetical protein
VLKETVLAVLNAEARLLRAEEVTDRALEDWIYEDLLEKPTEKGLSGGGSEWSYTPVALRAAVEVVRLRASKPSRRNTEIRLRLWLLDFPVPIDRVTEDLKSEFERLIHRRFFRYPWRYDARSGVDPTTDDIAKEFRRAGPPDQTLTDAGLVLQPAEDTLKIGSEWVWGSEQPSQLLKSLKELASQYLSEKGQEALDALLQGLEPYVAVEGLFGDPEEIERSGLKELDRVGERELLKARSLYQFVVVSADCAARASEFLPPNVSPALGEALSKIVRTLRESDEWCVAALAAGAIAAHRAKMARTSQTGQ